MADLATIQRARDSALANGNQERAARLDRVLRANDAFQSAVQSGNQERAGRLAQFLQQSGVDDAFAGIQQTGPGQFQLAQGGVIPSRAVSAAASLDDLMLGLPGRAASEVVAPFSDRSQEELLADLRQQQTQSQERFPGTAIGAALAGSLIPGAAASRLAQAARTGGSVASNAARLLLGSTRTGQAARALGAGTAAGAATAGVRQEDVGEGAAFGAFGAGLGLGATGVGSALFRRLAGRSTPQSIRQLARRIGADMDELAQNRQRFVQEFGEEPTLAEILPERTQAQLADLLSRRNSAASAAREGAERLGQRRGAQFAEAITGRSPSVGVFDLAGSAPSIRAQGQQFFQSFLRDNADRAITVSDDLAQELLDNPLLSRGLAPRAVRSAIQDAGEGNPVNLTLDQLQNLRSRLSGVSRSASDGAERQLAIDALSRIDDELVPQVPGYREAISGFRQRALRAEGFDVGRGSLQDSLGFTRAFEEQLDAETLLAFRQAARQGEGVLPTTGLPAAGRDVRAGVRRGTRSALGTRAQTTPLSLANSLLQEDGLLLQRLRQTGFSEDAISQMQRQADVIQSAIRTGENFGATLREAEQSMLSAAGRVLETSVDGLLTAAPMNNPQTKAFAARRLARRFADVGISERRALQMARDLFDPDQTSRVLEEGLRGGRGMTPNEFFAAVTLGITTGITADMLREEE